MCYREKIVFYQMIEIIFLILFELDAKKRKKR